MTDLRSQLRAYVEATVERVDAADIAALRAVIPRPSWEPVGWRRPALAIGAAFVITLAGIGTALLLTRDGEEVLPVATTSTPPVTTTSTPVTTTSAPATTTTGGPPSVAAWSYPAGGVPPFHATIAWDRNPESTWHLGYQESTALVEVWYESPRRFRFQLVELDTDLVAQGVPGAGQHLGGPGSYLVGDGEAMGQYRASDGTWAALPVSHYLAWMFWEPDSSGGQFDWAGQCREHATAPTQEVVAGREAYHITCSTLQGGWELWVDRATGLILRLDGETEVDDQLLGTSPQGGFQVTAIEFLEAPIPGGETLFEVSAPAGTPLQDAEDVPPLHVVLAVEGAGLELGFPNEEAWGFTAEVWYQDQQNWRSQTLTSYGPEQSEPGTTLFVNDGVYTSFEPETDNGYQNAYWVDESGRQHEPPALRLLVPTVGPDSDQVGVEVIAGRPALHFATEYADPAQGTTTVDAWIDIETGLQLKRTFHTEGSTDAESVGAVIRGSTTVVSIEFDPAFEAGIFRFAPEPGWCDLNDMAHCTRGTWAGTGLSQGEMVPTFAGPLADGTEFDLADLRGRPAIVFLWQDVEGLERLLADFEVLYAEWGDRVAFVSVPQMGDTDVRAIVARVPLTHLVVTCRAATVPEGRNSTYLCSCDPSSLWELAGLAWLMIDADGRAAHLLRYEDGTYEAITAMIAAAVGG